LPHVQKLYERIKDRKDIQIITFNVDDNVGLVEPFLKQNKYTFPVIPAKFLVDGLVPSLGVPQNWIVDTDGILRLQQIGFGSNPKWEDQMVEAVEKARPAPGG
jgi:hypothetical protein